jgi:hypothetical protein
MIRIRNEGLRQLCIMALQLVAIVALYRGLTWFVPQLDDFGKIVFVLMVIPGCMVLAHWLDGNLHWSPFVLTTCIAPALAVLVMAFSWKLGTAVGIIATFAAWLFVQWISYREERPRQPR